jgi:hypothetical protein
LGSPHHRILLAVVGAALVASGAAPAALAADDTSVDVGDPTLQYTRFYPRTDGYRDTVAIGGTTNEAATVTIRIYTSGGTRVKSFLLGAIEGAYGVTWNGRRKDGSLFPQGTYRVRHQFRDTVGNTLDVDRSVVLSHKKVYWHLGSQTRYADTGALFVGSGALAGPTSVFPRGVRLVGGNVFEDGGDAAARYTFTLPSAHVYSSLRVSVYGKSNFGPGDHEAFGFGYLGIRNVDTDVIDGEKRIDFTTAWYESSVPAPGHVTADRKAQAWVTAYAENQGYVFFQKVKLTYKYGILDY